MKNETQKMYELAISYLHRGWSILPCGKNKIPLIPWRDLQTKFPTEEEVRGWFQQFPDAQVGIITGRLSNLTVVDFEKGADPSNIPQETMIVSTGGQGYHYYYLYEEGVTNKARILPLVDYRSEGGFVVAGGSVSEKGPYTILQDVPLLPFPGDLLPKNKKVDIFQYPEKTSSHNFEKRAFKDYQGFGKGQRNDEMARYIGYVLSQIHPSDWDGEGWQIILAANQKNTPPLASTELLATFNSLKGTEKRNHPLGRVKSPFTENSLTKWETQNDEPQMLGDESDEIKHIADVAAEQRIDQNEIYPLQMPCFDDVIDGGVNPGDVVVIAGQTGQGKTTLAQDWTISMIRGDRKAKALWFSYEVLPSHLWKKFQAMGMSREDCAFIPAKHSTGNLAWVEAKIKEGKERFGIKSVFIDHLGFLLPKTQGILGKNLSNNYSSFLTQVMRDIKTIALREEVIIFLPVHMKKVDSHQRQADINDIKDSSGVGQESDLVFLIEREKDRTPDAKSYFTNTTKITLAKNRKTGTTIVGKFSMINGRFAYDDHDAKVAAEFENLGKVETPPVVVESTPLPPPPYKAYVEEKELGPDEDMADHVIF